MHGYDIHEDLHLNYENWKPWSLDQEVQALGWDQYGHFGCLDLRTQFLHGDMLYEESLFRRDLYEHFPIRAV